jgi:hypothetical protein
MGPDLPPKCRANPLEKDGYISDGCMAVGARSDCTAPNLHRALRPPLEQFGTAAAATFFFHGPRLIDSKAHASCPCTFLEHPTLPLLLLLLCSSRINTDPPPPAPMAGLRICYGPTPSPGRPPLIRRPPLPATKPSAAALYSLNLATRSGCFHKWRIRGARVTYIFSRFYLGRTSPSPVKPRCKATARADIRLCKGENRTPHRVYIPISCRTMDPASLSLPCQPGPRKPDPGSVSVSQGGTGSIPVVKLNPKP